MYKNISVILLVSLIITGCKNYKLTSDGGVRPKNHKFSYAKDRNLNKCELLDTNSIYVYKFNDSINNEVKYFYYRFCSKGKMLSGLTVNTPPVSFDYDNFQKGSIGYYYCDGKNIHLEIFGLFFSDYQYMKFDGEIQKDAIIITKARLNAISKYNANDSFIRVQPKEPLKGFPDW